MTLCRLENSGPFAIRVKLADGSWLDVAPGETREADIMEIDHGRQRASYRFASLPGETVDAAKGETK